VTGNEPETLIKENKLREFAKKGVPLHPNFIWEEETLK
jgi:hypothetical protein